MQDTKQIIDLWEQKHHSLDQTKKRVLDFFKYLFKPMKSKWISLVHNEFDLQHYDLHIHKIDAFCNSLSISLHITKTFFILTMTTRLYIATLRPRHNPNSYIAKGENMIQQCCMEAKDPWVVNCFIHGRNNNNKLDMVSNYFYWSD